MSATRHSLSRIGDGSPLALALYVMRETSSIRLSMCPPTVELAERDWAIVVAGTDSGAVSNHIMSRFGQLTPRAYLRVGDDPTLLEQTLDRTALLAPPDRTIAVVSPRKVEEALAQLDGRADHVICQPAWRDTGLGVFMALTMLRRWSPGAVVTITIADHHVTPAHAHVQRLAVARWLAGVHRNRVIVLGAWPGERDPDADYLELGEPLPGVPDAAQLAGYVRRPVASAAEALEQRGALWSTSTAVGTLDALWELGRATHPRLMETLESLVPILGTPDEVDAIETIYNAYLPINFARDMIGKAPWRCGALALDGVAWSDVASPAKLDALVAHTPLTAAG